MQDRPLTGARHWLASLVSRTRQLDGDSAEPINAAGVPPWPGVRDPRLPAAYVCLCRYVGRAGKALAYLPPLQRKKGPVLVTSNIYQQGIITKLH
jgi:hypothetical protein